MKKIALLIATSVCGVSHGEVVITCPPFLSTKDTVVSAPSGWELKGNAQEKLHKSNISSFFYKEKGEFHFLPPSEYEPLPNQPVEAGGIATWRFSSPRDIYFFCDYSGTDIIIIRRPPNGTSQCTIRADSPTQRAVCK